MRQIIGNEILRLKALQDNSMFDSCQIGTATNTTTGTGDVTKAWTYGSDVSCGIRETGGDKKYPEQLTVTKRDAVVRLPTTTSITTSNQIKITKRNGTAITNIIFKVLSVNLGVSCLLVEVEKIGV